MLGPMHMTGVLARSTIIDLPAKEDRMMPNIDSIIRDHVTLTVRCLDRIYLQGYMPKLQTSGGLCYFLRDHISVIRFPRLRCSAPCTTALSPRSRRSPRITPCR
jgi:hypothetical protein